MQDNLSFNLRFSENNIEYDRYFYLDRELLFDEKILLMNPQFPVILFHQCQSCKISSPKFQIPEDLF